MFCDIDQPVLKRSGVVCTFLVADDALYLLELRSSALLDWVSHMHWPDGIDEMEKCSVEESTGELSRVELLDAYPSGRISKTTTSLFSVLPFFTSH
jgi:hypothetical protein